MKLHQAIAVQGKIKVRVTNDVSAIYKRLQKPALYIGRRITYTPLDEADTAAQKPPEGNKVQFYVKDELAASRALLTELYNINATRDWANMAAKASVKVGGDVILADAPVPFLLFLKLELQRLRTEFSAIPLLDGSKDWQVDEATGGYHTEPEWPWSSRRVRKVLGLAPATDKHPAQTQLVEEEVPVAKKFTTDYSGAMSPKDRAALLARVDVLQEAVAVAIEEANSMEVEQQDVADKIFAYLLG